MNLFRRGKKLVRKLLSVKKRHKTKPTRRHLDGLSPHLRRDLGLEHLPTEDGNRHRQ